MVIANIANERNVRTDNEKLTPEEQVKLTQATIGHGNLKAAEERAGLSTPVIRSARRGNAHSPETIQKLRDFLNSL